MVDKVVLRQIYLYLRLFSPISAITSVLYTHLSTYQERYLKAATKCIVKGHI